MKLTTLERGDSEMISAGSIVSSGDLSSCTAIFLYNQGNRQAFASHLLHPKDDGLDSMISKSIANMGPLALITAYVAGSSIDPQAIAKLLGDQCPPEVVKQAEQEYIRAQLNERENVIRTFKGAGFIDGRMKVRWFPKRSHGEFILNIDTGEDLLRVMEYPSDRIIYAGCMDDAPNPFPD